MTDLNAPSQYFIDAGLNWFNMEGDTSVRYQKETSFDSPKELLAEWVSAEMKLQKKGQKKENQSEHAGINTHLSHRQGFASQL